MRRRKRFVLFEPTQARALYPYPVHHPLDQRSRIHLDALPAAVAATLGDGARGGKGSEACARSFPRLGEARGFEVVLEPGDVLWIPHHWWHYVETTHGDESVDGLVVSLNLWFDFEPRLCAPPLPLRAGLLVELSRHVEVWIGNLVGAHALPRFVACCAIELAACSHPTFWSQADAATASTLPRQWLVARNLLFCELALQWVGWRGLRAFFEDAFPIERYRDLQPRQPTEGAEA